jgi:hypothetical protein
LCKYATKKKDARRQAQLDLFQPVNDLVEVKDEVRAIGDE